MEAFMIDGIRIATPARDDLDRQAEGRRDGLVSLDGLWRSHGSPEGISPSDYLEQEEFLREARDEANRRLNLPVDPDPEIAGATADDEANGLGWIDGDTLASRQVGRCYAWNLDHRVEFLEAASDWPPTTFDEAVRWSELELLAEACQAEAFDVEDTHMVLRYHNPDFMAAVLDQVDGGMRGYVHVKLAGLRGIKSA